MDRVEFAKVMAVMASATGGKLNEDQISVYFELLSDLPLEVFRAAAIRAIADHRIATIPPVGLIRQHAAHVSGPPQVSIAEAFEKARKFAEKWYPWLCDGLPTDPKSRARFDADYEALPDYARQAGKSYGWPALVDTPPGVAFPHFKTLYESVAGPEQKEAALPPSARSPAVEQTLNRIGSMPALESPNGR